MGSLEGSMKKKPGNSSEPKRVPNLVVPRGEARERITHQIETGHGLISKDVAAIKNEVDLDRARHESNKWSGVNDLLLKRLFDDQSVADEYSWFFGGAISRWEPALQEGIERLRGDIQKKIDRLEGILAKLDYYPELTGPTTGASSDSPPKTVGRRVFVVHGRDEAAKEKTASVLTRLKMEPVILHQQADQGNTIIEKFEQHADVDFAVVLLTPDDMGGPDSDQLRPRARQNVMLELGFFLGKLGRGRVCALHKGDVEIPSDYSGVLYIPMDEAGAWEIKIAKELKAAGIEIDGNLLL
jgi:hypothetical protein